MTNDEFTALLCELHEAELNHKDWCAEHPDDEYVSKGMLRAYKRVQELQAKVDAEIEAEAERGEP